MPLILNPPSSQTKASQKFEVERNTRKTPKGSISEILVMLKDGKTYQSNPSVSLPQQGQKGNVCWYYALAALRTRYGKDFQPNANRRAEQTISAYRKSLTNVDQLKALVNMADDFNPVGAPTGSWTLDRLEQEMSHPLAKNHQPYFAFKKILESTFNQFILLDDEEKEQQLLAEYKEEVIKVIFDGWPDAQQIIEEAKSNPAKGFFEFMTGLSVLTQTGDYNIREIRNKLSYLMLALIQSWFKSTYPDCKNSFTLIEAGNYLCNLLKVQAVKTLYKELNIKIQGQFFENMLTLGVYNRTALDLLKQQAKNITKLLKNTNVFMGFEEISVENLKALGNYFSLAQVYAYKYIIELYDLKLSTWTPKQGFEGLSNAIENEGALVMHGLDIGLPAYSQPAQTLIKNGRPATIGSRTIKFWKDKCLTPLDTTQNSSHAVVVIGAQEITKNDQKQQFVLFLDPNDASIPGQERTVYRMSYEELVPRLILANGTQLTDPDIQPDGTFYAVASRDFRP